MDFRWILAFACGAALLLGACSGTPTPATTPTPPTQPTDPGPLDEAEDAFLEARAAVLDATTETRVAVAADTNAARAAAQTAIDGARRKLDEAVMAADAAVEAASGGTAEAVDAAARAKSRADQYLTEQTRVLDEAERSMGWARQLRPPEDIPRYLAEVKAVRRLRKNPDGSDAATLLKKSDIPPVMHEDGKIVMAPGGGGLSGDRLPMRGMPLIMYASHNLRYQARSNAVDTLASIQNNRPELVSGLTITRDSLVVDMGGKNVEGTDFRVNYLGISETSGLAVYPGRADTGQGAGHDLTLTFGRPDASPQGNAEQFWAAALMPTAAQVAAASYLRDGGRTLPLGIYHVRLSNHLGLDRMLEFEDSTAYPDDDTNSYLIYSAYGHMDFFRPGTFPQRRLRPPFFAIDAEHGYHRVFPFQVGHDAFKDEDGKRTTDIAAEDRIVRATFKGRTMAVRFSTGAGGLLNVNPEHNSITRMRGDIELTATIGTANDTITGRITNMEDWDQTNTDSYRNGYWKASTIIPNGINFGTDGRIDAKGEFTGTIPGVARFRSGGYRGNFYGPLDSLEAAGTWALRPEPSLQAPGIAGSFGAARVRDDGSYGTTVRGN